MRLAVPKKCCLVIQNVCLVVHNRAVSLFKNVRLVVQKTNDLAVQKNKNRLLQSFNHYNYEKCMKTVFIFLSIIFFSLGCRKSPNQPSLKLESIPERKNQHHDTDSIYLFVPEMPEFPGCEKEPKESRYNCSSEKKLEYLFNNLKYDSIKEENEMHGTIVVSFVIEKDGSASNVKVLKGEGISNIVDVIQKMPKWKPGYNNGIPKRVRFTLPIRVRWK